MEGFIFGLTAFFLLAWIWLCSLHFFSWKLMNFHIIQAWVRQMADRQVILKVTGRHGGKLSRVVKFRPKPRPIALRTALVQLMSSLFSSQDRLICVPHFIGKGVCMCVQHSKVVLKILNVQYVTREDLPMAYF